MYPPTSGGGGGVGWFQETKPSFLPCNLKTAGGEEEGGGCTGGVSLGSPFLGVGRLCKMLEQPSYLQPTTLPTTTRWSS